VPNGLPAAERERLRQSVVTAADAYLATLGDEAYGLPMPGSPNNYFWGSNSNIINNVIVIATAYDLTSDQKYQAGALQGMDYIFGRNALNHSYVTGWGEKSPQNQHSRIFGHQIDESLPIPPAGSIAGGANAGLDDPFAANLLQGCAPQFCYVDHIESFSTNEVAVNWNSALAWIGSFLADQGAVQTLAAGTCKVDYALQGNWSDGFVSQVTITNTGSAPVNGWTLRWAWTTDQKVRENWLSIIEQNGASVAATNLSHNRTIRPKSSVTFGFTGARGVLANPAPELFTLNGSLCQ
jgi:endoglucanase